MKKRRILSLLLMIVMIVITMSGCMSNDSFDDSYDEGKRYASPIIDFSNKCIGDVFWMGEYPQRLVEDTRTIAYLEEQDVDMNSFTVDDVTYTYGDFEYEGLKYRRINWTRDSEYRDGANNSKYLKDVNYYFVWSEVTWEIIGEVDGEWQIFSSEILDCQPMCTDDMITNWSDSSCREWLNSTFINDVFKSNECSIISTTDTSEDEYTSADKLYLMSFADMANGKFGFKGLDDNSVWNDIYLEDSTRDTGYTDYAEFFGIDGDTYGDYYLRSRYKGAYSSDYDFYIIKGANDTSGDNGKESAYSFSGIRPAFRISQNATIE